METMHEGAEIVPLAPEPEPEEGEDEKPDEPVRLGFEVAGALQGGVQFLSCTRCGALIAAGDENVERHNQLHVDDEEPPPPPRQREEEPKPLVDVDSPLGAPQISVGSDRMYVGTDVVELLRRSILDEIRLREIRQYELAEMTGTSIKHMSQMLSGAAVGSLKKWSTIAAALGKKWSIGLIDVE